MVPGGNEEIVADVSVRTVGSASPELNGIQRDLAIEWASVLERAVTSIGVDDDFFEIGGSPERAAELIDRIEEAFGTRLRPSDLACSPTLGGLAAITKAKARLLFGHVVDPEQINPGASERAAVFCVGPMGGTVLSWRRLGRHLDRSVPLFAVEATGFDPAGRPMARVEDIARYNVARLREAVGTRPVVLCGHSFGGSVAYQMARQLEAEGHQVAGLVLLDTSASRRLGREPLTRVRARPIFHDYVRRERRVIRARLALAARRLGLVRTRDGESRVRWVIQAQRVAYRRYRPGPYHGDVTLLAVESDALRRDSWLGWRPFVSGGIVRHLVPGEHRAMLGQEWVESTAAVMDSCLRRLSEPSLDITGAAEH